MFSNSVKISPLHEPCAIFTLQTLSHLIFPTIPGDGHYYFYNIHVKDDKTEFYKYEGLRSKGLYVIGPLLNPG